MLVAGKPQPEPDLRRLLGAELLARLERLDVRTARVFPGKMPGERRSKRRGRGVEFADYRDYAPGDDIRFVDWNAYARFDRLFIKLFHEDEDLALRLCLDASPSMLAADRSGPSKLRFAVRLAAAAGYLGLHKRNRVAAAAFGHDGDRVSWLPELRGAGNAERMARFLLDAEDRAAPNHAPGDPNTAIASVARAASGAGVLALFSDFLYEDGFDGALRALGSLSAGTAATGYDVYCFQILTPEEVDPEAVGDARLTGDVRLLDAETGKAKEVAVTPALLRMYREALAAHTAKLAESCAKRDIHFMRVTTDTDIAELLSGPLRRSGMLV